MVYRCPKCDRQVSQRLAEKYEMKCAICGTELEEVDDDD